MPLLERLALLRIGGSWSSAVGYIRCVREPLQTNSMERGVGFCVSLLDQYPAGYQEAIPGTGGPWERLCLLLASARWSLKAALAALNCTLCRNIVGAGRTSRCLATLVFRPAPSLVRSLSMSARYYKTPVSAGEAKMKCKLQSRAQNSQRRYKCLWKEAAGEWWLPPHAAKDHSLPITLPTSLTRQRYLLAAFPGMFC